MLVPIEARGARARVVAGGASILVALLVVALVCLGGDSLEPSADLSWSNSFDDGEGEDKLLTRLLNVVPKTPIRTPSTQRSE